MRLRGFAESSLFQNFVLGIVCLNAFVLGLLSLPYFFDNTFLKQVDEICLYFFIFEVCVKIIILRKEFFKENWNIFDLIIITLSALPLLGNISVLRLFRILKMFRLFSIFPQLRFVIAVISKSIPSVVCIGFLLLLVYYIYAVLGTQLFAEVIPDYFGDLGKSFFTLFQIMTGDSWSEGVARPTMAVYPYSWIYFVSFIVIVTFIVLNLVIGIIVDSINEIKQSNDKATSKG
ncbi:MULTISPECIES: ion transporter [Helicobacter]|uniref:Ion transporter n=3 Tax=Helicobacter typhlonius TaxID=76936 RepID=A0A0S4PSF8_9HELI|nr:MULTISPECIES: ion transporter [Helicobacter]TLD78363.1 ion transporter [Helicobacter typhlonius]TLD87089.1 ion transporter [Helicobacter sp. MIT 03-1616]CUU39161.1 Voltage-gated sodium channel subunit [Helicobacter typhlonius]HCD72614.1 ion transporter [Helicobacter sp.]